MVQLNKHEKSGRGSRSSCCPSLGELLSPRLFKALSDPKRVSLLVRLAEERCSCTVSQIAKGSDVDLSVVSRHLAILREAGIIRCEKRGKEVWCDIQTDTLARILRELAGALEACCPTELKPAEKKKPATGKVRRRNT